MPVAPPMQSHGPPGGFSDAWQGATLPRKAGPHALIDNQWMVAGGVLPKMQSWAARFAENAKFNAKLGIALPNLQSWFFFREAEIIAVFDLSNFVFLVSTLRFRQCAFAAPKAPINFAPII